MLYSFEDETTHSASLPSTLDMPRTALHYSGLWAVGEFKMKASETKRLGEELLRQPVKRVNNLPKLLTCVGGVGDEVCALKASTISSTASVSATHAGHPTGHQCLQGSCKCALHYSKLFFLASYERGSIFAQA